MKINPSLWHIFEKFHLNKGQWKETKCAPERETYHLQWVIYLNVIEFLDINIRT